MSGCTVARQERRPGYVLQSTPSSQQNEVLRGRQEKQIRESPKENICAGLAP